MTKQTITLEFSLEGANFDRAGEASSKIKRVLQQIGVKAEVVRRIAISSYEAELNVIIHAWRGTVTAHISPECTELIIEDEGPGIPNIEKAMEAGFSTAPDHIREMGFGAGMGLPNMKRYTDEMKIDTVLGKGTTVTMKVHV